MTTEQQDGLVAAEPSSHSQGNGPNLSSINAQLITHGWAKRPLKLDKLGDKDQAEVVTVLYELLGACVVSLATSTMV